MNEIQFIIASHFPIIIVKSINCNAYLYLPDQSYLPDQPSRRERLMCFFNYSHPGSGKDKGNQKLNNFQIPNIRFLTKKAGFFL